MQDEFPDLEYKNYQNEFLSDWWTRWKLFKGMRTSGKTTLIVSELRRFLNRDMNCLVLAPTQRMANDIKERYQKRFGEIPNCDFSTLNSHNIRGHRYEVVLMDEVQKFVLDDIQAQIIPMDPMFVRACSSLNLDEEVSRLFDSEYSV